MVFRKKSLWLCMAVVFSGSVFSAQNVAADIEGLKPVPFDPQKIEKNNSALNEISPASGQEDVDIEAPLENASGVRSVIQDGDSLLLAVEGEPDLTKSLKIGPEGNVDVPLIGPVDVVGRDISDIKEIITTRLKDGYINNPKVSVDFISAEPVYILGEVQNPGAYDFRSGLTPLKAAALAGGFSTDANQDYFELIEGHQGDREPYPATVVKMIPYFKVLKPGDTIKVKKQVF